MEKRIGYSAAALAAISFAILWVPNVGHAEKGVTGAAYLAVGLVLASFLALATASGRRALLVLASLFLTVGPWGPERLFQLLYLALFVWLAVRLFRGGKAGGGAGRPASLPTAPRAAPGRPGPRSRTGAKRAALSTTT
jgi:hypothetical protein